MKIYEKVAKHYNRKHRILEKVTVAMEELLAIYQSKEYYRDSSPLPYCPLCRKIPGDSCTNCPWVIMTGTSSCSSMYYFLSFPHKRLARIKQLRRWIAEYKKASKILALRRRNK